MLFPNVHNVVIVSSLADMNLQSFDMVPYTKYARILQSP
jgi:hypothetical protein